jgi:endonuclease G
MKKFLLLILALLTIPLSGQANPIDERCPDFVVWGAPVIKVEGNNQYVCHTGYALNYNNKTRVAHYVVEHVKKTNLNGPAARGNDFREDPVIPAQVRATLADYTASGYDRGHMAPAADFTWSATVMSESFYLSNMMPQNPGNNRGIWKFLEEQTRTIAIKYGDVYVITGTVYDAPVVPKIGNIEVPNRIYKIVIDAKTGKTLAHLFPNIKLDVADIDKYAVTVADIEQLTGINFSPRIPANLKVKETQRTTLKDW